LQAKMPKKYQNQTSLVDERTQIWVEVIFPLKDQTKKLPMVQERTQDMEAGAKTATAVDN
jgi:hypothetical protein